MSVAVRCDRQKRTWVFSQDTELNADTHLRRCTGVQRFRQDIWVAKLKTQCGFSSQRKRLNRLQSKSAPVIRTFGEPNWQHLFAQLHKKRPLASGMLPSCMQGRIFCRICAGANRKYQKHRRKTRYLIITMGMKTHNPLVLCIFMTILCTCPATYFLQCLV